MRLVVNQEKAVYMYNGMKKNFPRIFIVSG
jgi:hypothetical protein